MGCIALYTGRKKETWDLIYKHKDDLILHLPWWKLLPPSPDTAETVIRLCHLCTKMQLKKFSNHSFEAPGKAHNFRSTNDNPKIEAPMDCWILYIPNSIRASSQSNNRWQRNVKRFWAALVCMMHNPFYFLFANSCHLRKNIGWPVDNDLLGLSQIFWSWASIIEFNQKISATPIVIQYRWEGKNFNAILGITKWVMKKLEDSLDHSTRLPIQFLIKALDHLHLRWLSPHPCSIQSWNVVWPILGCYHLQSNNT